MPAALGATVIAVGRTLIQYRAHNHCGISNANLFKYLHLLFGYGKVILHRSKRNDYVISKHKGMAHFNGVKTGRINN